MATQIETTRKKRKMTQAQFWNRLGITQSGGSRYESGARPMPKPVQILFTLAYGNVKDRERTKKQLGI